MENQKPKPEDFVLDMPYEQLALRSLEQVHSAGESPKEKEQEQRRISCHMPLWLASQFLYLKGHHPNIPSVAVAQRLTAKLGIAVIRKEFGDSIAELESIKRRIFEKVDRLLLIKADRGHKFEFEESVSTTNKKCSLREWTAGAITDSLIDPLSLPSSTAVILTLIAGISRSETWLPRGWVRLAEKELQNFRKYLNNEIERLKTEVLGGE